MRHCSAVSFAASGTSAGLSVVLAHVGACRQWGDRYSRFTEQLPTRPFWAPMEEDEEIEVDLSPGNVVSIKYKALSELQPSGMR